MSTFQIKEFQELSRFISAILYKVNPTGIKTGKNDEEILRFLINFPGMRENLDNDFATSVDKSLQEAAKLSVCRGPIKDVYMYPELTYPDWDIVELEHENIQDLQNLLQEKKFFIKVVDNKINAVAEDAFLTHSLYAFGASRELYNDQYSVVSRPHISIVPSNVLALAAANATAMVATKEIQKFLREYENREFTVDFENLAHTISRDWPLFSNCFVLRIKSPFLQDFIKLFNKTFSTNVDPQLHITFAIKYRKLEVI